MPESDTSLMLKFYYIDDMTKQQCGPFGLQELSSRNIRPETLVWRSGMPDWTRADNVQELSFLFDSKIPVPQIKEEKEERVVPSTSSVINNTPSSNSRPDTSYNGSDVQPMPKNWMIEAVLLSIFCCSPISVVGIFYALKVERLYNAKEYDASVRASNLARNWALLGIMFLPVCYIIFVFCTMVLGIFSY